MMTEEIYTVCRKKDDFLEMKDFYNFEDAFEYYKRNKEDYISGKILHSYKITEEFFSFDKNFKVPRDQIIDMINNE